VSILITSLLDQINSKAEVLADQQAQLLSTQMAPALLSFQTTLVANAQALGITLTPPLPFTLQLVIYQWLLPQLQQAFNQAITASASAKLSAAGLI
jgi:hypothetical protein